MAASKPADSGIGQSFAETGETHLVPAVTL